MLHLQVPGFEILLRCSIVYVILLIGIRLTGKRQIGQMAPFDLVLLLLISNALQNAMTGPDTSLTGGIIAALTLLGLNRAISFFTLKNKQASHFIIGSATLLINHGEVVTSHLEQEGVTHEELMQALREHGIAGPQDVRLAVLEVDGSISVIRNEDVQKETRSKRHFRYLGRHSG